MARPPSGYMMKPVLKENEIFFLTGNGCKHYDNCLTCPYPDCKADHKEFLRKNIVVSAR